MTDTDTTTKLDELRANEARAYEQMLHAADRLAYDMTFRADKPNGPGHDKASPQLTRKLKANYIEASKLYDIAQAEVDANR